MSRENPTPEDVRREATALKVFCDLVEEYGALNPRPVMDTAMSVLAAAILATGNVDVELGRCLRELPGIIETMRPAFESSNANEPRN